MGVHWERRLKAWARAKVKINLGVKCRGGLKYGLGGGLGLGLELA